MKTCSPRRSRRETERGGRPLRSKSYKAACAEIEKIARSWKRKRQKLEDEKTLLRQKARDDARRMVQETRQDMEKLIAQLRSIENIDQKQLERAVQSSRDDDAQNGRTAE